MVIVCVCECDMHACASVNACIPPVLNVLGAGTVFLHYFTQALRLGA